MNFVANELRHVETLLRENKVTYRKVSSDLRLIGKYYLSQYDKQTSIELMVDFMNRVSDNGEKWRKTITSIVNDLIGKEDFELRDIEEIYITKNELDIIKSLDSELEQKYTFGLIVYCKIWNYKKKGKFVRIESTTHFAKDCDVNLNRENREKLFNRLKNKELINIPRKTGSDSVEVLCVDYEGEVGLTIPIVHIEKFIYYFYQWSGKYKVKKCQECGELILIKSKTCPPKRCNNCAKKIKNKQGEISRKCKKDNL